MKKSHHTDTQKRSPNIDTKELTEFLLKYAVSLLCNGAHTSRINHCTQRIGEHYGFDVQMIIWLKNITISISQKGNYQNRYMLVSANPPIFPNFTRLSDLSALSWQICDDKIGLKEAKLRYEHILKGNVRGFISSILFASVSNMAFCKLFGGDVGTLLCVFLGTFAGFGTRYMLTRAKMDVRGVYVLTAFVSSFVAYIGVHFGLTGTPQIAIGLSILYLIPGLHIINALVDVMNEYTLMALARGFNMTILVLCIAVGAYMTLSIADVNLFM